jgi:hypothetical protein
LQPWGEPRHALNQLILAWERNSRAWLEGALGPDGEAALGRVLSKQSWTETRNQLWAGQLNSPVSVGYTFEIPNRWSEPPETLSEGTPDTSFEFPESPEIPVVFKDSTGRDCGRHLIKFVSAFRLGNGEDRRRELPYFVNNSDVIELLRLIGSCAKENR